MIFNRRNGWELVLYSWDEDTGIGSFTYERQREDFDAIEERTITRMQPSRPGHTGWPGAWCN